MTKESTIAIACPVNFYTQFDTKTRHSKPLVPILAIVHGCSLSDQVRLPSLDFDYHPLFDSILTSIVASHFFFCKLLNFELLLLDITVNSSVNSAWES